MIIHNKEEGPENATEYTDKWTQKKENTNVVTRQLREDRCG